MKYTREELLKIKRDIVDNTAYDLFITFNDGTDNTIRRRHKVLSFEVTETELLYAQEPPTSPLFLYKIRKNLKGFYDFGTHKDYKFEVISKIAIEEFLKGELPDKKNTLKERTLNGFYTREQLHILKDKVMGSLFFSLHYKYLSGRSIWSSWNVVTLDIDSNYVKITSAGGSYYKGKFEEDGFLSCGSKNLIVRSKITNEEIPIYYFFDSEYTLELSNYKYVQLSNMVKTRLTSNVDYTGDHTCANCDGIDKGSCGGNYESLPCKKYLTTFLENYYKGESE